MERESVEELPAEIHILAPTAPALDQFCNHYRTDVFTPELFSKIVRVWARGGGNGTSSSANSSRYELPARDVFLSFKGGCSWCTRLVTTMFGAARLHLLQQEIPLSYETLLAILHSEAMMKVNLALGFFLSSQIDTLEATIPTPLWKADYLTIKYQLHTTALGQCSH